MVTKNLTVKGSSGCSGLIDKVLSLMSSKKIKTMELITEIFDFDNIKEAIELKLLPNKSIKTIVKIDKN